MDQIEVDTYKLMDCHKAHYPKEIVQVNERRYEFGNATAAADPNMAWVCSKVIKYFIKIAYMTTD
jgi:hypothetical protein